MSVIILPPEERVERKRKCQRESARRRYQLNRVEITARRKALREADPDHGRAWYKRNRGSQLEKMKQYRLANPEYWRSWGERNYGTRYGLSVEDVDRMIQEQCGRCAICSEPMLKMHIDHDHVTNKVRGLVCPHCNLMLGHAMDSPERLEMAAEYLRRTQ